ncbi:MAG: FecR domain-containing protein [Bacteroidales bacterium]|jgi:ferric-dicitrate binding protein FerR (iron transport regulator)|nr:FecR domain-containing protein [Bacteroidales bacterium]MCI2121907.1 FecR domain-containing protein [Bacteroidales bacterium]MCI2146210.1 FecR domain-containing protein [Bacteroidales bacterium]
MHANFPNFPGDDELKNLWDKQPSEEMDVDVVEKAFSEVQSKINKEGDKANKRKRLLRRLGIAAAIAIPLISLGFSFIYTSNKLNGVKHSHMSECFVPMGSVKTVRLPDGSSLTLNAGSVLIYPDKFTGHKREVYLNGEAVFEVAKDASHPFVVNASDFSVEVLGTVFDLSSYSDNDYSSVVLSRGSVRIHSDKGETLLGVNQKAEYSRKDGTMKVTLVNAGDYLAWSRGSIILQGSSIGDIIKILERRYGVKVYCSESDKFADARITAKFESYQSLEDFLNVLEKLIPGMHYQIEGGDIVRLY